MQAATESTSTKWSDFFYSTFSRSTLTADQARVRANAAAEHMERQPPFTALHNSEPLNQLSAKLSNISTHEDIEGFTRQARREIDNFVREIFGTEAGHAAAQRRDGILDVYARNVTEAQHSEVWASSTDVDGALRPIRFNGAITSTETGKTLVLEHVELDRLAGRIDSIRTDLGKIPGLTANTESTFYIPVNDGDRHWVMGTLTFKGNQLDQVTLTDSMPGSSGLQGRLEAQVSSFVNTDKAIVVGAQTQTTDGYTCGDRTVKAIFQATGTEHPLCQAPDSDPAALRIAMVDAVSHTTNAPPIAVTSAAPIIKSDYEEYDAALAVQIDKMYNKAKHASKTDKDIFSIARDKIEKKHSSSSTPFKRIVDEARNPTNTTPKPSGS